MGMLRKAAEQHAEGKKRKAADQQAEGMKRKAAYMQTNLSAGSPRNGTKTSRF